MLDLLIDYSFGLSAGDILGDIASALLYTFMGGLMELKRDWPKLGEFPRYCDECKQYKDTWCCSEIWREDLLGKRWFFRCKECADRFVKSCCVEEWK